MLAQAPLALLPLFAVLTCAMPADLAARASSEVVYLSTCNPGTPEANSFIEADYYSKISKSHNQQYPDSRSNRINGPNYYTAPSWEGQALALRFSDSGVIFKTYIENGANNRAVGDYAGTGNNGKAFTCYRDNNSQLFSSKDGSGHTLTCKKEYYCRPN